MLTLADLHYLRRLVQTYGYYEERDVARASRLERKLAEMIARARSKDCIVDTTEPWTLTTYRSKGGETMGKTSKAAPKKPKGKIGKSVKKK